MLASLRQSPGRLRPAALALAALLLLTSLLVGAPARAAREYVSALLMEAESGQILVADNIDREWIPASVVKLMLLLLAQEAIEDGRATPDDLVTATRRAQRQGGSQIFLGDGEQATLEKLLEAVAVGSANDAAVAVAVHLYGSADEAVKAMNARAASLGMAHTHYVNVTGLPERGPENHSTARDLSQLARVIVTEHPGVLGWTSRTWTRFRQGLVIPCTNVLLKEFEGMDGLKTGYHHKAHSNIVATAQRDGRRLIAVVLGSPSAGTRNRVASRLLERGFRDWELVHALAAGEGFGDEFPVDHGWKATVPVLAGRPLAVAVPRGKGGDVRVRLGADATLEAPLDKGQVLGRIQAVLDGRVLASVPALAGRTVSRSWISLPFGKEARVWPELPSVEASGMGGR
ncbi:MAG: D-alanyl-D-alanine carboxypeptidase family protein [Candidatus Krumholzibacteriia bacterium]|nr:D-alanyl-D-alanine carboxypeptidase [bacterium]MCB9514077.1 D-alanyl-D-alanine carboxypeptidase [Candidatus Latescibacterota bacterium]MCB9515697.1 D-alanyl-D-alanine carboxypeptidase [Candidatus Latescibacterota bacterium]